MNKLAFILFSLTFLTVLSMFAEYGMLSFTLAFATIALLPYLSSKKANAIDIFDPHVTLSVLLYLYSVSTLAFINNYGQTYYKEAVSLDELITYQLCCLLGIAGFSIGTMLAHTTSAPTSNHRSNSPDASYVRAGRIITALGIFFFLTFFYFIKEKFAPWAATSYGDMALLVRVNSMEDNAAGIKEIATETVPLFFILGACTASALTKGGTLLRPRVIAVLLLLAYLSTALLSGWRSQLMSVVVMIAVYYNYTHKKFSLRLAASGAVLVYAIINFLSVMRISSSPIEMIGLLAETFNERGMEVLAISQSGELATSTNLIRLISGVNNRETNFGYGSIAADQVIALMPRALMPDRPPIASERFVQTFYPGVYESGGGYGFFILQDGYWDFGLVGVFVYSLVFAILTQKIYLSYLRRIGHPFWTLFYGLAFYNLVFSSIRSGIFASIKSALIIALPVLLIYYFIEMFISVKKIKRNIHEGMDTSNR